MLQAYKWTTQLRTHTLDELFRDQYLYLRNMHFNFKSFYSHSFPAQAVQLWAFGLQHRRSFWQCVPDLLWIGNLWATFGGWVWHPDSLEQRDVLAREPGLWNGFATSWTAATICGSYHRTKRSWPLDCPAQLCPHRDWGCPERQACHCCEFDWLCRRCWCCCASACVKWNALEGETL